MIQPPDIPAYQGLTSAEAAQRVENKQTNKQPRSVGKSTPQILAGNFFTLFNLLNFLLAAALIAVGQYRNLLFIGVVVSNTVIGTVQEIRAKRTIDRLQLMSAPKVQVYRDGAPQTLQMEDVVLDDLVFVGPGDQLCADCSVTDGEGTLNESLLTGESEPVGKRPGDLLLSGSYVMEGSFRARVVKVGADSYASQLTQKAKAVKKPHSELMRSMRYIIRVVSILIVPLGVLLFYRQYFVLGRNITASVVTTVAAVLGMIPEGLMLLTSMTLAVGVVRLGKRKTLVQDLYGIESLARVDTLCMDKTGTITKGTMAVYAMETLRGASSGQVEAALGALMRALEDKNATAVALREHFTAAPGWHALHTVPFSSARKWSGAFFEGQGAYVMGAAELILAGRVDTALQAGMDAHASAGRRVMVLCHSDRKMEGKALPEDLQPVALVILTDVLREDAAETIRFFTEQDVALKIISGDNPLTVRRVAQLAGLPDADKVIDATMLDTPQKLEAAADRYTIFGRVTPDQKKDLILAMKKRGHIVGMMGDGVNDIPALKAADCAIAMAEGSDAARRVSQLTLMDACFSAVPHIVLEGRRVIKNITRAASLFLVKTIFSFLLALLLVIIPWHYPFAPIQMTLISTTTIGIPSFFLALEPTNARVEGNFLYNVLKNALPGGLTIVIQIIIMLLLSGALQISELEQSTIATWTTGFSGLFVLFFTCLPLNFSRTMLLSLMAGGFVGAALRAANVFYLVSLPVRLQILTAALIVAAPFLMLLMRLLIRWIQSSLADRKAIIS